MTNKRICVATGDAVAVMVQNGGGSWSEQTALDGLGIQCLAVDPLARQVVYAGSGTSGVYRSEDAGEHWHKLAPTGGSEQVFSLAVSPPWRGPSGGVVLAGTEPSALFVSESGGQDWRELPSLRAIPSAPTWSFPPRPWTSHVRWIALSPFVPGLILVSIEAGAVVRSVDFGITWEDHRPGAYHDGHALALHPGAPGYAYEAAGDGGAAESLDNGATWHPVVEGLTRHYVWALAVDPLDPTCWYVSASPGPSQAHHQPGRADSVIYRWRNQGPWEELRGGALPSPNGSLFAALASDPDRPGQLYAGLRSGQIYFTADYGENWAELPVQAPAIEALSTCG